MRRVWATFLLGMFSLLLTLPVVSSVSSVPACCRRDGKHHCQMQASSSQGPAVQSARCASYPGAQAAPLTMAILAAPASARSYSIGEAAPVPNTQSSHSSYSRAGQKRGPPSPLC